MAQKLYQEQKLTLEQIQMQSAMQVLASKLTELPLEGLKERIENELAENPYMEASYHETEEALPQNQLGQEQDYDARQDYSSEDDIPEYLLKQPSKYEDSNWAGETIDNSDSQSFFDLMMEQVKESSIADHDRQILEYLIGNLDANGMLNKPLFQIADELSIYHYCDTHPEEVERVLHILQSFEPAGVGTIREIYSLIVLETRSLKWRC